MALAAPTLTAGLTKALVEANRPNVKRTQVATRIAQAYDAYAKTAQSCAGLPVVKVNAAGLKAKLQKSMAKDVTKASVTAKAWGDAFETYWLGGQFGGGGTVTVIAGRPALVSQLTKIWATGFRSGTPTIAKKIATALDAFTRTVTVVSPVPPGGCAGPIL